jgi:SH3-like domain-containing protein
VRAVLIGAGGGLGTWLLVKGAPALYSLIVSQVGTEDGPALDGWLLALLIPIALWLAAHGVSNLRTHPSLSVRTAANVVCDLPERAVSSPTGHGLLLLLAVIVVAGGLGWKFWVATGHPLIALVLLAASLAGGWAVVLGAYALCRTGKSGRVAVAPLVIGLVLAALPFGIVMYADFVRSANNRIDPGGLPIPARPLPRVADPSTQAGDSVIIAVDVANVRSGPSLASSVVEQVKGGTQLDVVVKGGDWLQVRLPDGRTGWVTAGWVATAATWQGSRPVIWVTPPPGAVPRP